MRLCTNLSTQTSPGRPKPSSSRLQGPIPLVALLLSICQPQPLKPLLLFLHLAFVLLGVDFSLGAELLNQLLAWPTSLPSPPYQGLAVSLLPFGQPLLLPYPSVLFCGLDLLPCWRAVDGPGFFPASDLLRHLQPLLDDRQCLLLGLPDDLRLTGWTCNGFAPVT